jgi:hypothetical protein
MITETLISIALLSNFVTWYFEPLTTIREYIVDTYIRFCVKYNLFWATKASLLLTCPKCLAFWGTLVYTQNLIDAIIASILALLIHKMLRYVAEQ